MRGCHYKQNLTVSRKNLLASMGRDHAQFHVVKYAHTGTHEVHTECLSSLHTAKYIGRALIVNPFFTSIKIFSIEGGRSYIGIRDQQKWK